LTTGRRRRKESAAIDYSFIKSTGFISAPVGFKVTKKESNESESVASMLERIEDRSYVIGIVGLGYVGIPLALAAVKAGFKVIGFDIDTERVSKLNNGKSQIKHISDALIQAALAAEKFSATANFSRMGEPDAILIAVPTPLTKQREPDLSYVEKTVETLAPYLRAGQLVVLESTTWPGTTREVIKPILEKTGMASGRDFYLAFSPEREDPGNETYGTATIPKIVGGEGPAALELADALYGALVVQTVPVSSTAAAEAVKLTENIFRSVNIALVNELKVIYDAMGIDIWEVIDAAKTKPFGFMPFYPGPGLGGHCIPIDPFYLTWKAREFGIATKFIELAGQINTSMPIYVVTRLAEALDRLAGRGVNGADILLLGIAYKKNVDDMRESPALVLIEMLEKRGAKVDYFDPHIPVIPKTREHAALAGRRSQILAPRMIGKYDVVVIATDHDSVDYKSVVSHARLVVDTRNACARAGATAAHIIKA
jgi:UDP-N-acetyl-D-glucosamine dehydrogenase